jgi:ADP-ribose pyrophosphatase YjhB (NUDIX family)
MNTRKTPFVTVDIIIELPEGVIVIERKNPPAGWALPGGFVDIGESIEHAAAREAKEETNLDLEDLRQMHTYSDPKRDPRFHTVSTVFIAKGRGRPQSGDDAKNLKVVPYDQLLNIEYAFDHKQVVKDYLKVRKLEIGS